jgi:MoaA/NifB/PqqE/SkfB family radical SAM enzyme
LDNILDQLKFDYNSFDHIINCANDFETMKSFYRDPLKESNTKRKGVCLGSIEGLYIGFTGNVQTMCTMPIGNILNNSLKEIWYSENAKKIINAKRKCKERCHVRGRDRGSLIDRAKVLLRVLRN